MTRDEITIKITQLAADATYGCSVEEISDTDHVVNDLYLDELAFLEYVMLIEDEFGIDIPEADEPKILVIRDAVDYVGARLGIPT